MKSFSQLLADHVLHEATEAIMSNSPRGEEISRDLISEGNFRELLRHIDPDIRLSILEAKPINEIGGDSFREREQKRDAYLEQILGRDVLSGITDSEEQNALRTTLLLIIEAMKMVDGFRVFNEGLRKRFLRWFILDPENAEVYNGPVHIKDVIRYSREGKGLAKIGPAAIMQAMDILSDKL